MLPRHARGVVSRLRYNGHSLLLCFNLSRIGRIENPSCSVCGHLSSHSALSSYGLFGDSLFLSTTSGELPGFWTPRSSAMPPSLGRGRVINNKSCTLSFNVELDDFFEC